VAATVTTSTLTSIFRSHVDSDWNPDGEPDIDPLSTIVLDVLALRPPPVPWYGPDFSTAIASEPGRPVPFAYRFAEPVVYTTPDPSMVPQLSGHAYNTYWTICSGRHWRDVFYR
jgi:hypothetical protein